MIKVTFTRALSAALLSRVSAQLAPAWSQCGGQGYTGATICVAGWDCTYLNQYHSQCLQDTGATGTASALPGSPTLVAGQLFIRSIEDPNYHQYLQSLVPNTASDAVVGSPVTAAQFQFVNGQLVQKAAGKNLYAFVYAPANYSQTALKMSWSASPVTNGSFAISGDSVEWSSPQYSRVDANVYQSATLKAWYVCPDAAGNKIVYVNWGTADYMTPSGCFDETIHVFNGTSPTV